MPAAKKTAAKSENTVSGGEAETKAYGTGDVVKGRWATIMKDTGEVANISVISTGKQPEVARDKHDSITFKEVPDDVAIGMILTDGGHYEWPEGKEPLPSAGFDATSRDD